MNKVAWHRIALFHDLTQKDLEKIKPIFTTVTKETGEYLMREGEAGDEMFIMISGKVRVTKSMIIQGIRMPLAEIEDPRKILATVTGDKFPIFGEIALMDNDVRSASVETLEPSRFLVTNRARFFALVEKEPGLGTLLLRALGRRLTSTIRKNNSELVKLTTALALALSDQG